MKRYPSPLVESPSELGYRGAVEAAEAILPQGKDTATATPTPIWGGTLQTPRQAAGAPGSEPRELSHA